MPSGVYKRTAEMIQKGIFKRTEETKKKISKNNARHWLGKYFSKETRQKISKAQIGRIPWNKGLTKETDGRVAKNAKNISKAKKGKPSGTKGRKASKETRRKSSISHLGLKGYWEGKHHSQETKDKISKAFSGSNHPNWRGGAKSYTIDWVEILRRTIRGRDKYICQMCGKEKALHVHHIDYDKKNCNHDNLITLCLSCHMKTNYNRKYWIKYFKEKKEV